MTNSKTETKTNKDSKDLKLSGKDEKNFICFNFDKIGHCVSECKQPKREKGSCYYCGIRACYKELSSNKNWNETGCQCRGWSNRRAVELLQKTSSVK